MRGFEFLMIFDYEKNLCKSYCEQSKFKEQTFAVYTGCLKKNARSCLKPDISVLEAQILTSKVSFDIVMFSAFKWAQEQGHFTWKRLRKSRLKSANLT